METDVQQMRTKLVDIDIVEVSLLSAPENSPAIRRINEIEMPFDSITKY